MSIVPTPAARTVAPRRVLLPLRLPLAALLTALATALATAPAFAATLPMHGALRTVAGGPVADGDYVIFAALYDSPDGPQPVWEEALKQVPVTAGFFATTLGLEQPIPDALMLGGAPLWLGLGVAGDPELPRVPLAAVARSYHASVAASLGCSGCVEGSHLAPGAVASQHVAFTYAGSDSKGGAAKLALSADFATTAQTADTAAAADEAYGLQCTGCVAPNALSDAAKALFVSTTGGKVDGTLEVNGALTLGVSPITGGRFAGVDVQNTPCEAAVLGQVVLDTSTKRLYFCEGQVWRRLASCTGDCKAASSVACGQPISDDCGDVGVCPGKGTFCAGGQSCENDVCVQLGSQGKPATSCKDLLLAVPESADGPYWLDPDGDGGTPAFEGYCDMTTDGGGWTVLYAATGANGEQPATSNTPAAGDPLALAHYNLDRARKVAFSDAGSESLLWRSASSWLKVGHVPFDADLLAANKHKSWSTTAVASNGASDSSVRIGFANYNISGGGDFGVTNGVAFDTHSASYWYLNTSCNNHYLYGYSSTDKDSDAGYDINSGLGSWSATTSCDSAEGGALKFFLAVR